MNTVITTDPKAPFHLIMDDRERRAGVGTALARDHGFEIRVERLTVGDYLLPGLLVVERKTWLDLVGSVISGRLFRQANRLASSAPARACLIVEGRQTDTMHLDISQAAIQGAIISVTIVFGLPVLYTDSPAGTADAIRIASAQLRRRHSRPIRRHCPGPSSLSRHQIAMLSAIPGVGPTRARALLAAFGSPHRIAATPVEDLARLEGIGPHTARQIHAVMRESSPPSP